MNLNLVSPISRKKHITGLLSLDYSIILVFYLLLAFTGIFAFDEINDLYTLNFQPNPGEPWYMKVVHYFLSLFPVFTLSTNFPIIGKYFIRLKCLQPSTNILTKKIKLTLLTHNYHFQLLRLETTWKHYFWPKVSNFFPKNIILNFFLKIIT